jgi:hypothetical protein
MLLGLIAGLSADGWRHPSTAYGSGRTADR